MINHSVISRPQATVNQVKTSRKSVEGTGLRDNADSKKTPVFTLLARSA
ncbi:MAG: hypothetical protein QM496_16220 [Verrucomicrobiota bacterium]